MKKNTLVPKTLALSALLITTAYANGNPQALEVSPNKHVTKQEAKVAGKVDSPQSSSTLGGRYSTNCTVHHRIC